MAEPATRRRKRGLPPEELEELYPSLSHLAGPVNKSSSRAWVAVFNARPDAMHSLLADFIKQVYAQPGRLGQRPMPKEEAVDLQGLLYGEENDLPLTEILPKIVTRSERAMAEAVHMSRGQYQRMLRGEYDPDVKELRAIAKELKRHPTFFIEYRKAMAVAAFINLINDQPGIATSLYRKYLEVRM